MLGSVLLAGGRRIGDAVSTPNFNRQTAADIRIEITRLCPGSWCIRGVYEVVVTSGRDFPSDRMSEVL